MKIELELVDSKTRRLQRIENRSYSKKRSQEFKLIFVVSNLYYKTLLVLFITLLVKLLNKICT